MKIVRQSQIVAEAVPFTGPSWNRQGDEAWLSPATFIDGQRATITVLTKNSAWPMFVVGGQGSGKSSAINQMLISALSSGCATLWYVDGQWGASSPVLAEVADWAALTVEEAETMLTALEGVALARSWENKVRKLEGFTASPERPLLVVVVDECHAVWHSSKLASRWGDLLRISRKVGISIWAASQSGELQTTFAGNAQLRSRLCERTAICLYSGDRNGRLVIPGLEEGLNPAALPKGIPGYGWLASPQREDDGSPTGKARIAPMRFDFLPADDADSVISLFGQYPQCELEPVAVAGTRNAVGDAYTRRTDIAEERHRAELATFEQLVAGADIDLTDLFGAIPGETDSSDAAVYGEGDLETGAVSEPVPALTLTDLRLHGQVEDSNHESSDGEDLSEAQRTVLAAVSDGHIKPSQIVGTTGYSDRHVRNTLADLAERGYVNRQAHGRYALNNTSPNEDEDRLSALTELSAEEVGNGLEQIAADCGNVLTAVGKHGAATADQIQADTELDPRDVNLALDTLRRDGLIVRGRDGTYAVGTHNP